MTKQSAQIDFTGARGSNTGDVFHELWAVREALKLLDVSSQLSGITVEGVPAADGSGSEWDGVDCSLLYGGESVADAERVVIQQLSSPWSQSSGTGSRVSVVPGGRRPTWTRR